MPAAVLTPFSQAPGTLTGGRWRKRVLPVGEIDYKGRKLQFTRNYLSDLARAFKERAYDQVPFQLADEKNTHTNDPERTVGEITDMMVTDDGLYIEVQPNERGAAVLTANPRLGVSARIVEDYARADGQYFSRAIQHVLGTLDPRIPGLGPWSTVEAANDADIVIDLSSATFAGEEPEMPELTDVQRARLAQLLELDPARLAEITAGMDLGDLNGLDPAAGDGGQGDDTDEVLAWIDGLTDDELIQLEAEMEGETLAAAAATGLTAEGQMAVDLAQATADENARQLGLITGQLDRERWLREREQLIRTHGVPPFIADLAAPLLEGSGHVVDLANGGTADAGQIMRRVLTEYAKLGEQLGIGIELGSPFDEPEGNPAGEQARGELIDRARAQLFGLPGGRG